MQAMILAAGLGTRLRPLTDQRPKPLMPLVLRPMLEHLLVQLQRQGIGEVVVNSHYRAADLAAWLGDGRRWGMRVECAYEPEILGTAGGIKNVEAFWRHEPFLVLNADVLVDVDVQAVWQWHCQRDALVTMVLRPDPAAREFGAVIVDGDAQVRQINHRPALPESPPGEATIFTGIQIVSPEVLRHIPPGRPVSTTAETYPALLAQTEAVYGYRHTGYWIDIGVPERYLQAHWDVLDGLLGRQWLEGLPPGTFAMGADGCVIGPEPAGGRIEPPVVLGAGVELHQGARIGPYAVLGPGTRVGPQAVVRQSVVWDDVSIGPGAHLQRCALGSAVRVPESQVWRDGVVAGRPDPDP